jgi:hypothetical protein
LGWRVARRQTRAFTGRFQALLASGTFVLTNFVVDRQNFVKAHTMGHSLKGIIVFVLRCVISNRFGQREHKFKLFISRSYERKKPPTREVTWRRRKMAEG